MKFPSGVRVVSPEPRGCGCGCGWDWDWDLDPLGGDQGAERWRVGFRGRAEEGRVRNVLGVPWKASSRMWPAVLLVERRMHFPSLENCRPVQSWGWMAGGCCCCC